MGSHVYSSVRGACRRPQVWGEVQDTPHKASVKASVSGVLMGLISDLVRRPYFHFCCCDKIFQ